MSLLTFLCLESVSLIAFERARFPTTAIHPVADADELHNILSSLPLFPYMDIRVTPLARHPSALASG